MKLPFNSHMLEHERALEFIMAGKARFTIVGSENRFTYYAFQPKFDGKPSLTMRFLKVKDAAHGNDETYIGLLKLCNGMWNYEFRYPKKLSDPSKAYFQPTSKEVIAFSYLLRLLNSKNYDRRIEIWHDGKCGHCGQPLTTPESIQLGLGPVCIRKIKEKEAEMLKSETYEEFLAR
jgi:hypothetical protein